MHVRAMQVVISPQSVFGYSGRRRDGVVRAMQVNISPQIVFGDSGRRRDGLIK